MASWAHKILDDKGALVLVTSRLPEGDAFYYLTLSDNGKRELFAALEGDAPVELSDYGKIVHSGWGAPDEDDKAFMRKNYNADV